MNTDEIDWNAVIAVLNQRFPLQLEIAILQSRVNALTQEEESE